MPKPAEMNMSKPYVTQQVNRGVATIEFFHPAHNSLSTALLGELTEAIARAGDDGDVRVIVLRGGGARSFCAGAHIDELAGVTDEQSGAQFFAGVARLLNAMRTCPKFIIARVHGKAVGGGVGLVAASDYCLAHCDAAIRLSELMIGLGPFVVAPAIERKIGVGAMMQLSIDAHAFYPATWAQAAHLYAQVFAELDDLDEAVDTLSQRLAHYDPTAMRELKAALWRDAADWDELLAERAHISGRLTLGEFAQAALSVRKKRSGD